MTDGIVTRRGGREPVVNGPSSQIRVVASGSHRSARETTVYAIIGTAKLDPARADEARQLAKNILAKASEAPAFVSGTFASSADSSAGRSMIVFESGEAARALAEQARAMIPADGPTEVTSLEVLEVVDHR
jgi:hypothetical protein